ncbi:Charged multivesicular body protein 3 [Echinococcus granulosus]|nr:Charged multivesicular body protein 3 [Echinococcus granulosus]
MCNLSKEMMKLGLMSEMVGEWVESVLDQPKEMEEMAHAEVDKVPFKLTNGAMGKAPDSVTGTLSTGTQRTTNFANANLHDHVHVPPPRRHRRVSRGGGNVLAKPHLSSVKQTALGIGMECEMSFIEDSGTTSAASVCGHVEACMVRSERVRVSRWPSG